MADHVKVDYELWGCPVNKYQVVEVLVAILQSRRPNLPQYSLCLECKRQGNVCVTVAYGMPCLGPIVRAGCGALCPSNGRGCYGCFGPLDTAEVDAFVPVLKPIERYPGEAVRLLRTISGNAPAFVGCRRFDHHAGGKIMAKETINVPALARVEGEGGLYIGVKDGKVEEIKVNIYEPPRFFEGFLRGRFLQDVPDITARICGICPVAYQFSSIRAMEKALGITVPPQVTALRKMLYYAEWIESHVLHIYMLQGPDLTGHESAISLAADAPEVVVNALRAKKIGNGTMSAIAGRSVHPVNACVGGWYRWPDKAKLEALLPELRWGLEFAKETVKWATTLPYPELEIDDYEFVAVHNENEYGILEGDIISSSTVCWRKKTTKNTTPRSTSSTPMRCTATPKTALRIWLARWPALI